MSHLFCPYAPACKGPCKDPGAKSSLEIAQAANRAFLAGKPLTGPAYEHLTKLVRKNAQKTPSTPGMK